MQNVMRMLVVLAAALLCLLPALSFARVSSSGTLPRSPLRVSHNHAYSGGPVLRLAMPNASPTVDPAMAADEQDVEVSEFLYSGLVRLNPDYHIVGDAATSWSVSRDHRGYTFHIRKGLRFSNGDPLTARDFEYSITRSLSPDLKAPPAPTYLLDIKGATDVLAGKAKSVSGIKVLGPHTLQITARWAVPYFLMELANPTSFALDSKRLKQLPPTSTSWYANPIGSGPYTLKASDQNSMTFVRNMRYRGPVPFLKGVNVSFQPLSTLDVYQYVSRSLDVVNLCSGDKAMRRQAGVNDKKMLAINGVYMNMNQKPFDSTKVRRALTEAVDRKAAVKSSMAGTVSPFSGFVPAGEAGYDPALGTLPYSVKDARSQLATAGYPDGKNFPATTIYYAGDPCNPQIGKLADAIARAWHKNLNIPVASAALNVNALIAKVQTGSLPVYIAGWSADYPDPHDWLSLQWSSDALNNNVHYHSKRFDSLVQTADVTWNYSKRMQLYNAAQAVLVHDAAWIPLYLPHRLVYLRPSVINLSVTGYGLIPASGSWAQVQVRAPAPKAHRAF